MRRGKLLQRLVEPLLQLELLGHARRRFVRPIARIVGEIGVEQHALVLLALPEFAHHVRGDAEEVG